jgi:aspartate/methionine/tyrosine aminotransferase
MGILDEAFGLEREGKRVIHLEKGELDLDTPEVVKDHVIRAIRENRTRYVDSRGLPELRQAIRDYYEETYGVSVDPAQVLVNSGSSPAMLGLFLGILSPGDEVILPNPGYPAYPSFVEAAHGKVVWVGTEKHRFAYTAELARPCLSPRTKAVVINFPANPTGAVIDERALRAFAGLGPLVVSDEVYHGLTFDGSPPHTILEFTENAVVVGSFSKAFAMTGWRLGYIIAPKRLVQPLLRLHQYVFVCANAFVQWAAIAALENAAAIKRQLRDELRRRSAHMLHSLAGLGFEVPCTPQGGFYVFARLPPGCDRTSARFAADLLQHAHVAITPGPEFGSDGEGYVRFSSSSPCPLIEEAMERISTFLKDDHARAAAGGAGCAAASSESPTAGATPSPMDRLTGWQGGPEYFRFLEYDRFEPDPVVDVLRGRVAGVIFRHVIEPTAAAELLRRFWDSPARRQRVGEVCKSQGCYLGTYHYHKPTRTYLEETAAIAAHLAEVLDIPNEPSRGFRDRLGARLAEQGVTLRLAQKDGLPACPAHIRYWNTTGDFALQPHEDRSQCREPRQADFEIQRTVNHAVCAVNMCLENGEKGRLVYWNIVPDDDSKTRLGVYYSGCPYPPGVLADIDSIWLDVRPGDIYVFNGHHIHGVESMPASSKRTTLSWLMGFCDDRTVVTWT